MRVDQVGCGPRIVQAQAAAPVQGGRAESGQCVGRGAAQGRVDVDAAAQGQISAGALIGAAEFEFVSVGDREGLAEAGPMDRPVGPGHGDRSCGSRDRGHAVTDHAQHGAAAEAFEPGRGLRIADQPIAPSQRRAVGGTGTGDAHRVEPGPTEVLDQQLQAGSDDFDSMPRSARRVARRVLRVSRCRRRIRFRCRRRPRLHRRRRARLHRRGRRRSRRIVCARAGAEVDGFAFGLDEPHDRAGHEQGRRLPVEIPQSRLRAPDELPAAGGGPGVDAGEFPGQGDRADGHTGAR